MKREQLLTAIAADNWDDLRSLGWADVFRDLKDFFSPKHFSSADAMSYARVLGNHDPAVVHEAVGNLAAAGGEWRPRPAKVASEVLRVGGANAPRPGPRRDADEALRPLVVAEMADGGVECACPPARELLMASSGVAHCATCWGIDPGQVDLAVAA